MSAIFILLAVGALIGTWNMAGTIPTVVDYGVRLLNPTIFFVTTASICAVVGMVTGSSWTTAGTLGVAFVGMAKVMGLVRGGRRGRGDLRRVLRRQDDAAVRDDDPRPEARRPRPHRRAAHPQHVLDRRAGARHQPRSSSWSSGGWRRPPAEASARDAALARPERRVQHLGDQSPAARAARASSRSGRCRRSWRSSARRCSPASSRASPSGRW